jgi:hypothetical protein
MEGQLPSRTDDEAALIVGNKVRLLKDAILEVHEELDHDHPIGGCRAWKELVELADLTEKALREIVGNPISRAEAEEYANVLI